MKHTPVSPIFRNDRARWEVMIGDVLRKKSKLPESMLHTIVRRAMTRRPAHVLLMRPIQDRASMIMELIVPAVHRAERRAGLR